MCPKDQIVIHADKVLICRGHSAPFAPKIILWACINGCYCYWQDCDGWRDDAEGPWRALANQQESHRPDSWLPSVVLSLGAKRPLQMTLSVCQQSSIDPWSTGFTQLLLRAWIFMSNIHSLLKISLSFRKYSSTFLHTSFIYKVYV